MNFIIDRNFICFLLLCPISNVFTLLYERKYEKGHFSILFCAKLPHTSVKKLVFIGAFMEFAYICN